MKGYFAFEWAGEKGAPGRRVNVRVLFKPTGACSDAELASAIENSLDAVLAPDIVALICAESEIQAMKAVFRGAEVSQAVRRASSAVCIALCSFDRVGSIRLVEPICNSIPDLSSLFDEHTETIRDAGLMALFSAPHVLVTAPPGFAFVKPSQKRSTDFLRAEEALTEAENVQFLAFCLLHRIARRCGQVNTPIEVFFVDSMAIATVAYALRDLYCSFYGQGHPRVESFHSHAGLKNVRIPLPGTSFCLISASSSMNLERDWRAHTGCFPSEVVTLLTLEGARDAENSLHALTKPSVELDAAPISVLKDLPIVGERFLPEELLPKKVVLRKDHHRLADAELIAQHLRLDCFYIQRRLDAGARPRPVYFNGEKLRKTKKFVEYMDKVLRQKVPASVQAIIYQADRPSKRLARVCSWRLRKFAHRADRIPIYSQAEVEEGAVNLNEDDAIMIVAAVVGRGTKLLSVSRDLRNLHKGARTYLIGAQIAQVRSEIVSLAQNLRYSAEDAAIGVECFLSLAVGKGLSDSFDSEYVASTGIVDSLGQYMSTRYKFLPGSLDGLAENCFLPSGELLNVPLRLRKDFAYWPPCYEECAEIGPAVFATVCAILQQARDKSFADSRHWLNTDAFQQVVLAPENFARYNDGLIQAALLRAAHPSELDYSREAVSSAYMLEFLLKIFQQSTKRQGEASAEFALALSTGRLKLRGDDFSTLKARLPEALLDDTPLARLIRRLLGLESMVSGEQLPPGF